MSGHTAVFSSLLSETVVVIPALPKDIRRIQWQISEESRQTDLKTSYVPGQGFVGYVHAFDIVTTDHTGYF